MMSSLQFGAVYSSASKSKAKGRALHELDRGEKVVLRQHWQIDLAKTVNDGKPRFNEQWLVTTGKEADIAARTPSEKSGPPKQNADALLDMLGLSAKLKLDRLLGTADKALPTVGKLLGGLLNTAQSKPGGLNVKDLLSGAMTAQDLRRDMQAELKKFGDLAEMPVDSELDVQILKNRLAMMAESLDKPKQDPHGAPN